MKSREIGLVACIAVLITVLFVTRPKHHPTGPMKVSFWYWQTPYTLSTTDQKSLKEIGVKQIFVRAGTFSGDGKNVVLMFPQKYGDGAKALPVHLVFNADSGLLRHFESYDVATIAAEMAQRMEAQVVAAQRQGLTVKGVQLDFDVATRLLPRYANLIAKIRSPQSPLQKRTDFQFSMTGLMSWLGTRGLETLSNEVDFIVPQAYEGEVGKTPDEMRPIFDPDDLKRRLPLAERLNCPYWIGIPAYGHALIYDEHNHLRGTYRGLEAQDALRHPTFQLLDDYPTDKNGKRAMTQSDWTGEEILKFKAIKPAPGGNGLGFTLAFNVPSPTLLANSYKYVQQNRDANCQGVIIYRMPEAGSSFTIPLDTIQRALRGEAVQPKIEVKLRSGQDAFEAVETGQSNIPIDVFAEISNVGTDATYVSPQGLVVQLSFDKPGIGDVRPRDIDTVKFYDSHSPNPNLEINPIHSDQVRLSKGFLAPGQKILCGPLRLLNSGPVRVKIRVQAWSSSGFQSTDFGLPDVTLGSKPGHKN